MYIFSEKTNVFSLQIVVTYLHPTMINWIRCVIKVNKIFRCNRKLQQHLNELPVEFQLICHYISYFSISITIISNVHFFKKNKGFFLAKQASVTAFFRAQ